MVAVRSAGEQRAATADFVECYQAHYHRLQRALRLAGADPTTAEDLAQEAFARALVHWWRVRRGDNPPGYVYRTAFRLLARHLSRRGALDLPAADQLAGPDADATTRLAVEAVLAAMPARRRLCATLCFVVGLSSAEAAQVLHIAPGTVRKQLAEARHDLQGLV